MFVGAFLPLSTSKRSLVVRHQPSPSVLYGGVIGNEDFTKIFGKEVAAERRTRDLAYEYRPPPKDHSADKEESSSDKKEKEKEDTIAKKKALNTTKVVPKYVSPENSKEKKSRVIFQLPLRP